MAKVSDDDISLTFDENRPVLYVNVVIEDVSEAIKTGVKEKIEKNKALPPRLRKRLAKHVGHFAANFVTASKVASKAAPGMAKEMPIKMKSKGLTLVAEPVFQEGPYFVIMMQVKHANLQVMMEAKDKKKKKKARADDSDDDDDSSSVGGSPPKEEENCLVTFLKFLLSLMGVDLVNSLQSDYLPDIIQSKLQSQLDEMMSDQMYEEKKMKARCDVLNQESQSRYFYAMLKEIREAEAAAVAEKSAKSSPRALLPTSFPPKVKNPFLKKASSNDDSIEGEEKDTPDTETASSTTKSKGSGFPNPFKKSQ